MNEKQTTCGMVADKSGSRSGAAQRAEKLHRTLKVTQKLKVSRGKGALCSDLTLVA
jgi:hypothetical protein